MVIPPEDHTAEDEREPQRNAEMLKDILGVSHTLYSSLNFGEVLSFIPDASPISLSTERRQ